MTLDGVAAREQVRAAELIASLSLATDLGTRQPFEHGLEATLVAMRLAERLGLDDVEAAQTYYACLLFYVGCSADADVAAELFGDSLHEHFTPVMFGSRAERARGLARAIAPPSLPVPGRAARLARGMPRALAMQRGHLAAICEVGVMLTGRLGLPATIQSLFEAFAERWDGTGMAGTAGEEIPLPVRIVHVARDAAFQRLIGGTEHAARVVSGRGGGAFDPRLAELLATEATEILALEAGVPAWDQILEKEPEPVIVLESDGIDRGLAAIGDFADLISPYLAGHSAGVATLAAAAGELCGFTEDAVTTVRRAAQVHDVGRIAVPTRIWQKPEALTADEWEQVRLHPYQSERVLSRSELLGALASVASADHERLDGSGYHRGVAAAALSREARLLAAADAYVAMTQPRPYRAALGPNEAAGELAAGATAGRLDADAVGAVLAAAGQQAPPIERPMGLTDREAEVLGLLARGLQTKQVARALGISVKTADRHIQNTYGKIGCSTRAAATLFAMEHGLVAWGELPIAERSRPA
jgi:HD-GYP domain-containing protein (c-di-GMP phosphodiesterase class II)